MTEDEANRVLETVDAMDAAGAAGVFLVRVAREVAAVATDRVEALTIGIGSGPDCNVQMLALHDLLGLEELNPGVTGGMAANFGPEIVEHLDRFHAAVIDGSFPTGETWASLPDDRRDEFDTI